MLFRRHGTGEIMDSRCLSQMLDLLQSHDVYERLFARDSLCLQVDAKASACHPGGRHDGRPPCACAPYSNHS